MLVVRKFLAVLDLALLRLGLDDLKGRLDLDGILDHGPQLIIMEAVGLGHHGMVSAYLVLPVEEVPVGCTTPMAIIDA